MRSLTIGDQLTRPGGSWSSSPAGRLLNSRGGQRPPPMRIPGAPLL